MFFSDLKINDTYRNRRAYCLSLSLLILLTCSANPKATEFGPPDSSTESPNPAHQISNLNLDSIPSLLPNKDHFLELKLDPNATPPPLIQSPEPANDLRPTELPSSLQPKNLPQIKNPILNQSIVVIKRTDNSINQASYYSSNDVLMDPNVELVGCTRCGQLGDPGSLDFGYCATGRCTPGRAMCYPYVGDSMAQRISSLIYQCLSCPDPCYEASWNPLANAGFLMDTPRPQTMARIQYNRYSNMTTPDRAGFFWSSANGTGRGPNPLRLAQSTKGVIPPVPQPIFANINDATYSMEAGAGGKMGLVMSFPYRLLNTNDTYNGASGFGDMSIGTKSVLLDSELLLLSMQFKTYIPIGNTSKGLGLGTVRLEPTILMAIKLSDTTFLQGQFGEWIPIGGSSDGFGGVFLSKFSVNHQLLEIIPKVPLIGVLEIDGWTFQNGTYTQLFYTPQKQISAISRPANQQSYWNIGPGARIAFSNRADLGVGMLMGLGSQSWGNPIITVDFRWMY